MSDRGGDSSQFFVFLPLLVAADAIVLFTDVAWLRLLAGLAWLFVFPGLAWLLAFDWLGCRLAVERVVLVGGLSVAISSTALLAAVYWPAPLDLAQVLIALNLSALAGLIALLARRLRPTHNHGARVEFPTRRVLLVLLLIVGVAVALRTYSLDYGEFHEDELENMRLAVRAMKGEEYAPFLDSKGPIHWLLPAALWLMHGWLNEALARSIFVICSVLTILAIYAWGRRTFGETAGLVAAGFASVNGLLLAYARHVEGPSIIVLWGVVVAWCAAVVFSRRRSPGADTRRIEVLGWFLLAIGLVTHPTMILYLLPFVLTVAYTYLERGGDRIHLWRAQRWATIAGVALLVALAAAYYVPFVLDPDFKHAVEYFAGERVGTGFLYNAVPGLLSLEADYSTRYFLPVVLAAFGVLVWNAARKSGPGGVGGLLVLLFAMVSTIVAPQWWQWGPINAAFLPYAALVVALVASSKTDFAVKSTAVWLGVPYLALAFLAKDAATHIRNAYPALFLLAGAGLVVLWNRMPRRTGRHVKPVLCALLAVVLGMVLSYEYLEFLSPVTTYERAEAQSKADPASIYNRLYGDLPRPRKLVSNPRLGGWKVVGSLYDSGELKGDFRSLQESFAVPIWYTHQMPRSCFDDPSNYFGRIDARGEPGEVTALRENGYGLTRIVLVDHQPRLMLFERGVGDAAQPVEYDLDDYRTAFDRTATPARFISGKHPQQPLSVTFGGRLLLLGYDVDQQSLEPGDTLSVSLHWQALSTMNTRYRAFVHVEQERMVAQHDDDPVCRLRTDEWRPPQSGLGQFRLTIDPTTRPGVYPVTVGVYNPDTGERMEAADASGQPLGSVFQLTTVEVVP